MTETVNIIWFEPVVCCMDQEYLHSLFIGNEWITSMAPHYNIIPASEYVPDGNGAIVVFKASLFVDEKEEGKIVPGEKFAKINNFIAQLPWVLLIGTSDEESRFLYSALEHPNKRVWSMTPKPDRMEGIDRGIGLFYSTSCKYAQRLSKSIDWIFAGQVTHPRRMQCFTVLQRMQYSDSRMNGALLPTQGFMQGLDQGTYYEIMAQAKIAPCPSGPFTPESFRIYESLELGALPLLDSVIPYGERPGYWPLLLGKHPLPVIDDWEDAPPLIEKFVREFPYHNNTACSWWQLFKRQLAYDIVEAVEQLRGAPFKFTMDVTYIVPVSALLNNNPSISDVIDTIAVLRSNVDLRMHEVIIIAEPPHVEDKVYNEFLRRLIAYTGVDRQVVVTLEQSVKLAKTPGVTYLDIGSNSG